MRMALVASLAALTVAGGAAAQQADPAAPPPPGSMRGAMRGPGGGMGGGGMGGGGMIGALMAADANHDGVITREEVLASSDSLFDRLDANHDGVVTPDEMRAGRRGGTPPTGDLGATPPPPPGAGTPGAMGGRSLGRQQWHDRALAQFDRLDANHDGRVDRTEIANYREAMRERRQERRAGEGAPPPPPPGAPQ